MYARHASKKNSKNSIETNSYGTLKKLLRKKILIHTRYSSVIKIHAVIITIRLIISPCHKKKVIEKFEKKTADGGSEMKFPTNFSNTEIFRLSLIIKESVKNEN